MLLHPPRTSDRNLSFVSTQARSLACAATCSRLTDVLKALQPEFVCFVHEVAACIWVLAISRPDTCFFGDHQAVRRLRNEMPSMIVTMASFSFVSPERNPADALIRYEFSNAGLDRAVEDSEAIKRALANLAGCLVCNIFDNYKPVGPVGSICESGEGTVAVCMDQEFVMTEHGSY